MEALLSNRQVVLYDLPIPWFFVRLLGSEVRHASARKFIKSRTYSSAFPRVGPIDDKAVTTSEKCALFMLEIAASHKMRCIKI